MNPAGWLRPATLNNKEDVEKVFTARQPRINLSGFRLQDPDLQAALVNSLRYDSNSVEINFGGCNLGAGVERLLQAIAANPHSKMKAISFRQNGLGPCRQVLDPVLPCHALPAVQFCPLVQPFPPCVSQLHRVDTCRTIENARVILEGGNHHRFMASPSPMGRGGVMCWFRIKKRIISKCWFFCTLFCSVAMFIFARTSALQESMK